MLIHRLSLISHFDKTHRCSTHTQHTHTHTYALDNVCCFLLYTMCSVSCYRQCVLFLALHMLYTVCCFSLIYHLYFRVCLSDSWPCGCVPLWSLSLASGLWSLVSGLWSLVSGLVSGLRETLLGELYSRSSLSGRTNCRWGLFYT